MHKETGFGKLWISYGWSFKRFAIGFCIDTYHADIDLGFFWFGIEF